MTLVTFEEFRASPENRHLSDFELAKAYVALFDSDPDLKRQAQARVLLPLLLPMEQSIPKVIILVHGIRTFGEWEQQLERALKLADPATEVYPVTPVYVDLVRFLWPWGTRRKHVDKITGEIRAARAAHPNALLMVVAHSFGTYIITEILRKESSIEIDRLILCGAIVRRDYDWHKVKPQIKASKVVNDIGSRDVWPLVAKHITTGYGDSGRFGFGTVPVVDRWFFYGHSDFFRKQHFRKYWVPFLTRGQIVPSPFTVRRPKQGLFATWAAWMPYKWIVFAGAMFSVGRWVYAHHLFSAFLF
jgi:hypothetical protein